MVISKDNTSSHPDRDPGHALLRALIDEHGQALPPDMNILEVWIKSANIRDGALPTGASSFIVLDFFDYESQTTGLLLRNKASYDFATTFKIKVDDFMLRYLATDVVTLELNMAHQGDFSQLARCSVPLAPLLLERPVTRLVNHPMVSILSPDVVARVTVEMRLAVPVAEMYKLFLQRHPGMLSLTDMKTSSISSSSLSLHKDHTKATTESVPVDNEARLFNELEITVVRCTSVPMASDHNSPHAYVHFQFLGNPDTFTNPIKARKSQPYEFRELFVFPMVTYDKQLRLMARSPLLFTVLDLKAEEQEIHDESGLIGTVPLSLKALIEGKTMDGSYPIISPSGTAAGNLQVILLSR